MANHLSMAINDSILALHQRGWSQRRIARELNIDRETVARHLQAQETESKPANAPLGSGPPQPDSKPAIAPIGSEPIEATSKPANAPIGSDAVGTSPPTSAVPAQHAGRGSDCEPWRKIV